MYLLLHLVFLFAVFIFGISDSFSFQLIYSFDFWGFDYSEKKIPFLFTKRGAGAFDVPFSSLIFQIQSFVSPVVFGLSLCGFLLWNQ